MCVCVCAVLSGDGLKGMSRPRCSCGRVLVHS